MGSLQKDSFLCIDCESTGLEPTTDRIIEIAYTLFTFDKALSSFESLIDPECPIPEESQAIHNISAAMVHGKPKICSFLPQLLRLIESHIVVGHGINFDLALIKAEAARCGIPASLSSTKTIDTLRLARLYGGSPTNSLEKLREHFNITEEGAHRAMNDVTVNIEVFKYLVRRYKTTEEVLNLLQKPILLKTMPLGKHKGRKFDEIPLEYLLWAANKDFDQDLLYSIRSEIKKRKKGTHFEQASNPFSSL